MLLQLLQEYPSPLLSELDFKENQERYKAAGDREHPQTTKAQIMRLAMLWVIVVRLGHLLEDETDQPEDATQQPGREGDQTQDTYPES